VAGTIRTALVQSSHPLGASWRDFCLQLVRFSDSLVFAPEQVIFLGDFSWMH
jgi:hypothetical protein